MAPRKRKANLPPPPKVKSSRDDNVKAADTSGEYVKLFSTLTGAFLFSCLCTAIIWYLYIRDKTALEYVSIQSVEVMTLSSSHSLFVEEVVKGGKPVIIRNSFITQWPAMKRWNPDYLIKKQKGGLFGVYENSNKWFGPYYEHEKPMAAFTKRINNYSTNLNFSTKDFVSRLLKPSPGEHIYYTGGIDQFENWATDDITPYAELLKPNPARSSINVWIGQPEVTAHCHYDGYHNFYAQIYGRKKFLLFNPTSYSGLYPYPFLHPSHAQAQVNLSSYEFELFPQVKELMSMEAHLGPGDLLYIPPLWYHHVEAVDVSMSVNIWTDTKQSEIMQDVFGVSLPIDEVRWNGEHLKAIGSSVILYRLVEAVCNRMKCLSPPADLSSKSSGWYLVHRLWESRYRPLMDTNVLKSVFVSTRSSHGHKSILCENDILPNLFYKGIAQKIEQSSLDKYLIKVPKLIVRLPRDTWETWFGNYIEYIAYKAVALENIGIFLNNYDSCINQF